MSGDEDARLRFNREAAQRLLDGMLGTAQPLPTDELLDAELAEARAAGLRASAVDPPFATLIKRAEALNGIGDHAAGSDEDDARTVLAKRLDAALNTIEEEIRQLVEGFEEWTQHVADYGFDLPEHTVAVCVVASVDPELRAAAPTFQTARELAEWLVANPVSFRVLRRALTWATCTFGTRGARSGEGPTLSRDASQSIRRRFLRQVFAQICDEVRGFETVNDYYGRDE